MDIKCTRYPHLWGKKLIVEGREVAFDDTGVCREVDPALGAALLRTGAYADVTLIKPAIAVAANPAPSAVAPAASKRAKQAVARS